MALYVGVTRGAQVTGVAVCSLSLTWISTLLRFYVRFGILKFAGREDWLTIAAMIIFTIFCSLCLRLISYGLGAHMFNISSESLETGFKLVFVSELLYVVTTAVTKLSIGAYFLRLSSKRYQVRIIYATLAVVLLFSTMYFFFLIFQCTPINFLWMKYNEAHRLNGSCLSESILSNVTYAHAAMSAITDWVFGILPIFFVWNMQMNPRTKISVILILSLGFFASSATIVRIVYIKNLTETNDFSWEGINIVKWSMVEPAIAITAMNIATLRPMFKNFFFFAKKRFDNSVDEEETRTSGESDLALRSPRSPRSPRALSNNVNAKDYSVEFAEMLGLSRVGVTTMISAGANDLERDPARKRFSTRRMTFRSEKRVEKDNESQTELSPVDNSDWSVGIKSTTVITIDK